MNFFVATIVERTTVGTRQTVQQSSYTGHTYVRGDGLAATMVCDGEYPARGKYYFVHLCRYSFYSIDGSEVLTAIDGFN